MKKERACINVCRPHTILKIELISSYVQKWSRILLTGKFSCNNLVYIDAMSNCGIYSDENGQTIRGTAIHVAEILKKAAYDYPEKCIFLFFNDLDKNKCSLLSEELEARGIVQSSNFKIEISNNDKDEFLSILKERDLFKDRNNGTHSLLFYDPYDASINWDAIEPFINRWGEVIINHMISDPIRGMSQAKDKMSKYEITYEESEMDLKSVGTDKEHYKNRIRQIALSRRKYRNDEFRIAGFPFFIRKNVLIYEILHLSASLRGFDEFKNCAWKVFGRTSSNKKTNYDPQQAQLSFGLAFQEIPDIECYNLNNIVDYLLVEFKGESCVSLDALYEKLKAHPVFPSNAYRNEIKKLLKEKGVTRVPHIRKEHLDFTRYD